MTTATTTRRPRKTTRKAEIVQAKMDEYQDMSSGTPVEGDPVSTIEVKSEPRMAGDTEVVQVETVYEYADGSIRRNAGSGKFVKLTKADRASIADLPRTPYTDRSDKFVWKDEDVTVELDPEDERLMHAEAIDTPEPNRQGHPKGTADDPHNPPEEAVSDANTTEGTQPATPTELEPEKAPSKGPQPHTLEVRFAEADKVPRHFWSSLGADGGSAIAKAHGVGVQANGKAESLILTSGKKADLDKAHKAIVKTWTDAVAASKVWRANDEYKAASTQDRWRMLNDFLRTYAHDIADVAS